MKHFSRPGFTLVELLIVIVIIGMLVGITLPAINMVRESGRQTVCLNNQQNVGKAILGYDMSKKRLPWAIGEVKTTSGNAAAYTWALAIMPELGRQDVWTDFTKNGTTNLPKRIDLLCCPNDLLKNPRDYLLSFGMNYGTVSGSGTAANSTGLFRVKTSSISPTKVSLADLSSTARVVLFSEQTISSPNSQTFKYSATTGPSSVTAADLNIYGFALTSSELSTVEISARLPSCHAGLTIMTFADGHTEKVSNGEYFQDANIQTYP